MAGEHPETWISGVTHLPGVEHSLAFQGLQEEAAPGRDWSPHTPMGVEQPFYYRRDVTASRKEKKARITERPSQVGAGAAPLGAARAQRGRARVRSALGAVLAAVGGPGSSVSAELGASAFSFFDFSLSSPLCFPPCLLSAAHREPRLVKCVSKAQMKSLSGVAAALSELFQAHLCKQICNICVLNSASLLQESVAVCDISCELPERTDGAYS